jgi:ectoine hydroxylase-related dioxygenase (phytanoyl-CoA dioxygenase family)
MLLTYLDRSADAATVADALRRDGAVAVNGLIEPHLADTVATELRPQLDAEGLESRSIFNGDLTRRYGSVMSTAPSAAELVGHDLVISVADEILLPFASTYRISSLTAIEIMPGESDQALHRDDTVYPIDLAGMELTLGVMWSLSDFTEVNGGTRVIPGSHRYLRSWHLPDMSRWETTVMPKGSAVFYLGSTWHGGGANESNAPRLGLINSYCLGWLRPEVNQYLTTPPEIAARYGPRIRALLGYMPHGASDDLCGGFSGECPAWVDTPPEPTWRSERGQIATIENAKTQGGG